MKIHRPSLKLTGETDLTGFENLSGLFLPLIFSSLIYLGLAYFIPRENFLFTAGSFTLLFLGYIYFLTRNISIKQGVWLGLFFRAIFLFSIPALSDDFYRFIWDAKLMLTGNSPYAFIPLDALNQGILDDQALFEKLNSQGYYSVYPPICQFISLIGASLSPKSIWGAVVIMKCIFLAMEAGSIFLIRFLLTRIGLNEKQVLWYALNPLVIVEFTGNLHFETAMVFFSLLSIAMVVEKRSWLAGGLFTMAFCTKFLPALLYPLLVKRMEKKQAIIFTGIAGLSVLLLFAPFYHKDLLSNIGASLKLYSAIEGDHLEFNSGIFFAYKWLYYHVSKVFPMLFKAISLLLILVILLWKHDKKWASLFRKALLALTVYFLFSNTVHPWYIASLTAFGMFTPYRYIFVWTAILPFTYLTYSYAPFRENYWLVAVEFILVIGWLLWELKSNRSRITDGTSLG